MFNHQLMFQLCNSNPQPVQLGSKVHICGVLLPTNQEITNQDINGNMKACKRWKSKKMKHMGIASDNIDKIVLEEFPKVLTNQLRKVRKYEAPCMRFHSQVPSDGGKQADVSGGARPFIQKQLQEWVAMEVVKPVEW